ncbi:MAG: DUF72 domain-containing protein [Cyclobacteriaceae bacterium]
MDFGKVDSLENIDFTLPPDASGTTSLLKKAKSKKKPEVFVGCAKWGRKDWVGKIYPEKTKEADFLEHYARHFNCIELNATFYRMPTQKQVEGWRKKVGYGFQFCPKFTDQISHYRRLKDAEELTERFLEGVSAFKNTLGPIFLQLPPNFTPKNFDALKNYLETLPKDIEVFTELRSPKWFLEENFETVFSMMEENKIGSIITDASGRRDCVHMRLTTPVAFIRFVGNGLHPTDYTRVDDWVQRIKTWMDQGIERVYFFMHQHEEIYSPELSRYVIRQLNKVCGTVIPEPKFVSDASSGKLFS